MPRPKKHTDGICQICGYEVEVCVSGYKEHPFIDGRRYQEICFLCSEVPKMYEYKNNELIVYDSFDDHRLHTAMELVEEGFDKKEAQQSIRAVKRAIKTSIKKTSSG